MALADHKKATKTQKVFTQRLSLFLGSRLQPFRGVEQELLYSPVADPFEHPERRLGPEDLVAPR